MPSRAALDHAPKPRSLKHLQTLKRRQRHLKAVLELRPDKGAALGELAALHFVLGVCYRLYEIDQLEAVASEAFGGRPDQLASEGGRFLDKPSAPFESGTEVEGCS